MSVFPVDTVGKHVREVGRKKHIKKDFTIKKCHGKSANELEIPLVTKPHLRVCQGELSRHIHQVAFLRVTLHPHGPVLPGLGRVRPVLVALGLPEHDTLRTDESPCQDSLSLPAAASCTNDTCA